MSKQLSVGEMLLGFEGLALLRHQFDGSDEHTAERLAEIRDILDGLESDVSVHATAVATHELDPTAGYAAWSASYDEIPNPLIEIEQRVLDAVLAALPRGRALDVACGTGRVTELLNTAGHLVVGVDASPEMLAIARRKLRHLRFQHARLDANLLAVLDESTFDLVTCSLALTHLADLDSAVAHLALLVRPGGDVVISDVHPFSAQLGTHALFNADDGVTSWVRTHPHSFQQWLAAFRAADLELVDCREVVPGEGEGPMAGLLSMLAPETMRSAVAGLPVAIVWHLRRRGSDDPSSSSRERGNPT